MKDLRFMLKMSCALSCDDLCVYPGMNLKIDYCVYENALGIQLPSRNDCDRTAKAHEALFVNPYLKVATTLANLPRKYPIPLDLCM